MQIEGCRTFSASFVGLYDYMSLIPNFAKQTGKLRNYDKQNLKEHSPLLFHGFGILPLLGGINGSQFHR